MELVLWVLWIGSSFAIVYPYLIYPMILRTLGPKPVRDAENRASETPSVALLVCCYNEETTLSEKMANCQALASSTPGLKMLFYSDCSSDGTDKILQEHSDLVETIRGPRRTGKVIGMQRLVEASDADILVFSDANVILDPDAINRMLRYFRDPDIGCVAARLHYVNKDESVTANTGTLYWNLEERIKALESKTGSTIGADGSLFAIRRDLYPHVPSHLPDDMVVSLSALVAGFRIVSAPDVKAYERSAVCSRDEFKRKRRIACQSFAAHRHLLPGLKALHPTDVFKYYSHKYVRWFGAFFVAVAAASCSTLIAMHMGTAVMLGLWCTGCCGLWLAHRSRLPYLSHLTEILSAMIATAFGILDAVIGQRYQLWEPTKSR